MSNYDLKIFAAEKSRVKVIAAAEQQDTGTLPGVVDGSSLYKAMINPIDSDADEG